VAVSRCALPSIDGIFVLDDLVGFIGEEDFKQFALPYFKRLFAVDVSVKFFHNDARCAKSIKYYPEIGINLYNPGVFNTLAELRALSGHKLSILGNIPPRDVLAQGCAADVRAAVQRVLTDTPDRSRLILSCAGGMPPGVTTENLRAFIETVAQAG
jgi:uroporphyrinogen-III decarboxylase